MKQNTTTVSERHKKQMEKIKEDLSITNYLEECEDKISNYDSWNNYFDLLLITVKQQMRNKKIDDYFTRKNGAEITNYLINKRKINGMVNNCEKNLLKLDAIFNQLYTHETRKNYENDVFYQSAPTNESMIDNYRKITSEQKFISMFKKEYTKQLNIQRKMFKRNVDLPCDYEK